MNEASSPRNPLLGAATQPTQGASPPAAEAEPARARLLGAALRLFAKGGFTRTSIRDIAEAACVNVAAINYYFRDKAGLYRAVFQEPLGSPADDIAGLTNPNVALDVALNGLFANLLEPLRHGEMAQLCMQLHVREMLEPTGLWAEEIDRSIKPMHEALVEVLRRHLGLPQADDDVQRLALSIVAMAVHLFVGYDVIDAVAPQLRSSPAAIDIWQQRMLMFAMAMVDAEAARRTAAGGAVSATPSHQAVAGTGRAATLRKELP